MKAEILTAARIARAPQDLIDAIAAAETDEELHIYRRGVMALLGQKLQAVGAALTARGDRVRGAQASAAGRSAVSEWEAGDA